MGLTASQMDARLTGLGGSDAGAIAGVSPYAGPYDVYARFKTPDVKPERDKRLDELAELGNLFEEPVAQLYSRRTGHEVREVTETLVHPKYPWMIAHPDRLVLGAEKGVEIKTVNWRVAHRWGSPDDEEIRLPEEYLLQCVHYMAVTGIPRWDVAALIGGSDFRIFQLKRDPELEELLIGTERDFWERYIEGDEAPPLESSPKAADWAVARFGSDNGTLTSPTPEAIEVARMYADARDAEKSAKADKELFGSKLKTLIGDSAGFRWGRKSKATWTNNRSSVKTDWEAVARELNPNAELIARFTREVPGARVLRVEVKD